MTRVPEKKPSSMVGRKVDDHLKNTVQVLNNEDVKVWKMTADAGQYSEHNTVPKRRQEGASPDLVPWRTSVVTSGSLQVTCRTILGAILYDETRTVGTLGGNHKLIGRITFTAIEDDTEWHCIFTKGRGEHVAEYGTTKVDKFIPVPVASHDTLLVILKGRINVGDYEHQAPCSVRIEPGDEKLPIRAANAATWVRITAEIDPDATTPERKTKVRKKDK